MKSLFVVFLLCAGQIAGIALGGDIELAASRSGESEDHESHQDFNVFVGVTAEGGEKAETIGFEYEYHTNSWFGIGGLLDFAGGDVNSTVAAPVVFFHPYKELKFLLAAGYEFLQDAEAGEDDEESVVRVGVAWDFEINESTFLAPAVSVDFVDSEEIWIIGVNVGFMF